MNVALGVGLEPTILGLTGRSYIPLKLPQNNKVQKMGFEPMFDAISTTATSIEDISFHRYFCICNNFP